MNVNYGGPFLVCTIRRDFVAPWYPSSAKLFNDRAVFLVVALDLEFPSPLQPFTKPHGENIHLVEIFLNPKLTQDSAW